jgi:hypothetical protein
MKFYIVQRDLNNVNYDEYDSVVVYAHNMAEALELAVDFQAYFAHKDTTVTPIKKTRKAHIVHESFNAG